MEAAEDKTSAGSMGCCHAARQEISRRCRRREAEVDDPINLSTAVRSMPLERLERSSAARLQRALFVSEGSFHRVGLGVRFTALGLNCSTFTILLPPFPERISNPQHSSGCGLSPFLSSRPYGAVRFGACY